MVDTQKTTPRSGTAPDAAAAADDDDDTLRL